MAESSEKSNKIVLADFGDWSKPVNTLIEKCSDAIGGLFKPYQITRVAEAEAEAEEIRAQAHVKIDKLQRRAATRFIAEETKKQINMEAIIRGALPQVDEAADPEKMNDDWVTNFFDKCRLISDEQMQVIWSKILAGEANNPGNFSKRTVNLVAELNKVEVELFGSLCRYAFEIGEGHHPVVLDWSNSIYAKNGVTFASVTHLSNIGVISLHATGNVHASLEDDAKLRYHDQLIDLSFPNGCPRRVNIGWVTFSASGWELSKLVPVEAVSGLVDYVLEFWKRYGITASVSRAESATLGGGSNLER